MAKLQTAAGRRGHFSNTPALKNQPNTMTARTLLSATNRILAWALIGSCITVFAQSPTRLTFQRGPNSLEITWTASFSSPDGSVRRPLFEVQQSSDLSSWQRVGQRLQAQAAPPDQTLKV